MLFFIAPARETAQSATGPIQNRNWIIRNMATARRVMVSQVFQQPLHQAVIEITGERNRLHFRRIVRNVSVRPSF